MSGTEIFLVALGIVTIIMMFIMLWWPVATAGAVLVLICAWGIVSGYWESKMCEHNPEDPSCVEYISQ